MLPLLNCEESIANLESLTKRYAGKTPWFLSIDSYGTVYKSSITSCPFVLQRNIDQDCYVLDHMMASFAFGALNVSRWPVNQIRFNSRRVPGLYKGWPYDLPSFETFATEEPTRFGLITSDGLINVLEWLPVTIIQPLSLSFWCLTAISTLAVSTALVALGHLEVRNVIRVVFTVTRTLIGQTVSPFGNESNVLRVPSELRRNLVWAIWLLVALLITNYYLGAFKSNYIFDPPCIRNWSNLLDMDSENIILVFG